MKNQNTNANQNAKTIYAQNLIEFKTKQDKAKHKAIAKATQSKAQDYKAKTIESEIHKNEIAFLKASVNNLSLWIKHDIEKHNEIMKSKAQTQRKEYEKIITNNTEKVTELKVKEKEYISNLVTYSYKDNLKHVIKCYRANTLCCNKTETLRLYVVIDTIARYRNIKLQDKSDIIQDVVYMLLVTPYNKNKTVQKLISEYLKTHTKQQNDLQRKISKNFDINQTEINENKQQNFVPYTYSKTQNEIRQQVAKGYKEQQKEIKQNMKDLNLQNLFGGNAHDNYKYSKLRKEITKKYKGKKQEKILKVLTEINKGKTIKEIERQTNISHNSIAKYIDIIKVEYNEMIKA